jgi:beta-lactamase class A
VTAFAPGLDDATTRFDRNEPQLNVSTGPDDERDTTTPAAIVESMRAVPLGGGLRPAGRERITPRSSRTPPATPPSPRRQRSRYGGSSVNSRHTPLGKERSWDT